MTWGRIFRPHVFLEKYVEDSHEYRYTYDKRGNFQPTVTNGTTLLPESGGTTFEKSMGSISGNRYRVQGTTIGVFRVGDYGEV